MAIEILYNGKWFFGVPGRDIYSEGPPCLAHRLAEPRRRRGSARDRGRNACGVRPWFEDISMIKSPVLSALCALSLWDRKIYALFLKDPTSFHDVLTCFDPKEHG